jgi:hypothetical protein
MSRRTVIVAVIALLAGVGLGVRTWAQVPVPSPSSPGGVISGADFGFRVESTDKDIAIGKLMVRVNGKWLEARFAGGARVIPLHSQ